MQVAYRLFEEVQPQPAQLDANRFSSGNRRRLSAPSLPRVCGDCRSLGLTEEQRRLILGLPSRSTYQNWTKAVREHREITLDVDVLTRISAILGIHQSLGILFSSERDGIDWVRGPHQATVFGGNPPLNLITSGTQDGIMTVRRFLDAARGGSFMAPNEIDVGFRPYTDADIVFS